MLKRRIFIPATALCCSLLLAPSLQALPLDAEGFLARLSSWVLVFRPASPALPARAGRAAAPGKPRIADKNGCAIDPQGRPICSW
jgi:hypothetical protein